MKKLVFFSCLLFLSNATIAKTEHSVRDALSKASQSLLLAGNYAELENLSKLYNNADERTPSGVWKLGFFYEGMTPQSEGKDSEIDSDTWALYEKKYADWKFEYPDSYAADLFFAELQKTRAWYHRGGGYSNTVSQSQWKMFYKYLRLALEHLKTIEGQAHLDPHFYSLQLDVAQGLGWDDDRYDELLTKALTVHPYYYPLYFSAITRYAPRWRGSALKMEEFAQRAVGLTSEKEGEGMYARVYWAAPGPLFGKKTGTESLLDWELMKRGMDDVLARFPDQWNINNFAKFACLAGDRKKLKQLVSMMDSEPLKRVWGEGTYFSRCKSWSSYKVVE